MSRRLAAVVLVFVLLALPARAGDAFARYDLALDQALRSQNEALEAAAREVADWANGRADTPGTLSALDRRLAVVKQGRARLEKLTPPAGGQDLHQAALEVARSSVDVLAGARAFVQKGVPDRAALRRFAASHLEATSGLHERWLKARADLLPLALAEASAPVQQYYTWQSSVLPLRREQLGLVTTVQRLMLEEDEALEREARAAMRRSLQLRVRADSIRPAPFLEGAHQAFLEEQVALAHLCEAGSLLAADPSPESASRVRRFSQRLAAASSRAEEARLNALSGILSE